MNMDNFAKKYKDELEKIDSGNSVEVALYFIIELFLRNRIEDKYWITNTSTRRKEDLGNKTSVPDLMIFDNNKGIEDDPIAIVEIKYFPYDKQCNMDSRKNGEQVDNYLTAYPNVIYTNGIEWRFIKQNNQSKELVCLGVDSDMPKSYYNILDRSKRKTKITWKEEKEFDDAWTKLKEEIDNFFNFN